MTGDELVKLIDLLEEYLLTLDDEIEATLVVTDRGIASQELDAFLVWLRQREEARG